MTTAGTRGVLLTAADSPLIQALASELIDCPEVHSVVAVHQPGEPLPAEGSRIHHVTADLTRRRDVQNLLQGIASTARLDTIVHSSLHPHARDRGALVFRLNVETTRHLLAVAEEVFNIPGKDSLPLSELIHRAGRIGIALPGPILTPLYELRARATSLRFHYQTDQLRFHHGCILEGSKARERLHYHPQVSVSFDMFRERAQRLHGSL